MLAFFLNGIVVDLENCRSITEIDGVLKNSIEPLYKKVPEFSLLKGKSRASVEATNHAQGTNKTYYGFDLTMEETRALLGAHSFLLILAGTETAYKAFVRHQNLVPGKKPILRFGQSRDELASSTFLGMHNFIKFIEPRIRAAMFYAALINDLGKTELLKEMYREQFNKDPEDNDETLGKILVNNPQFEAFNAFDESLKKLIMRCFNMPCTFSELQQIERPKQSLKLFSGMAKEDLWFHYCMEYFGDVPGAVLPPADENGNMVAASQTMHQETVEHIAFVYDYFVSRYDASTAYDFVKAYQDYANIRLSLCGLNPYQTDLTPILPIIKFAIGASRTGTPERGAQIVSMVSDLPQCVKDILIREFETLNLDQSIYMLNIVPLVMGPFYPIAPRIKEGMTVGLCLAAYLYEETRKIYPGNTNKEFKANASHLAGLFNSNVTTNLKEKILAFYEAIKGITDINQVRINLAGIFQQEITPVPASNGVRFLVNKIEKVKVLATMESSAVPEGNEGNTGLVGTLFLSRRAITSNIVDISSKQTTPSLK